jgi:hypothetical protein
VSLPVRIARLIGPAGRGVVAATAGAGAAALVEPADIADDLFEEGQLPPRCWCRAGCRRDVSPVLQIPVVDRLDDAALVEIDDVDLLVDDVGIEERISASLSGSGRLPRLSTVGEQAARPDAARAIPSTVESGILWMRLRNTGSRRQFSLK